MFNISMGEGVEEDWFRCESITWIRFLPSGADRGRGVAESDGKRYLWNIASQ